MFEINKTKRRVFLDEGHKSWDSTRKYSGSSILYTIYEGEATTNLQRVSDQITDKDMENKTQQIEVSRYVLTSPIKDYEVTYQ